MKALILTLLLFCFCFMSLAQKDSTISVFSFDTLKAQLKLVKVELTPGCGTVAFTTAQKFEMLWNRQSFLPKKYVIVLQQCPELLGKNFFVKGRIYETVLTKAADDAGAMNSHRHEKLPTYWCNKISLSLN
jgi:hypothetical protein